MSTRRIESAADLEGLSPDNLLVVKAALAAGYKVELRTIDWRPMVFVDGKVFSPLNNWAHALRLVLDTGATVAINNEGYFYVGRKGAADIERCAPSHDDEVYRIRMCKAVVTEIAKACPE